jgi:DNA-binding CsgD family transcriptional regulator
VFSAQGAWVAALELVRGEASSPFQPTDETFLQLLAPTIGRLLCAALAQEHPGTDGRAPGPDTAGILVLSPQGHVAVHTAAAERWLALLRRGEESLASPVPLAVWSAVAQLRSAAADPAQALVRVPTASGILRVEASRGHPDDFVAVALVPERRPVSPVPPATPALAALTPQEKRVLGLLLCGRSTREMAAALVVSVNTVETHLRHIYEKLAVPGRGALLARVLQDTDGLVSSCLC